MDSSVLKCCPNCSQPYSAKITSSHQKCRIPLFLKCGHVICESCIKNMLKFKEPINCNVCHQTTEVSPNELMMANNDMYTVFPVDLHTLGEISLRAITSAEYHPPADQECFVDLNEILKSLDTRQGQCVECRGTSPTMCKQCVIVLCEKCFKKTHTFHIFKSHVLKDIELQFEPSLCSTHNGKKLDYFCKDCKKSICMDCMIVGGEKSCKNHNVTSVQEMNTDVIEDLNSMSTDIDTTYKRLTKTAVDIGYLLKNIDNNPNDDLNKMISDAQNYFSQLYAAVQTHEQHIKDYLDKLKNDQKQSLLNAKTQVAGNIKKAKALLNKTEVLLRQNSHHMYNLPALLEEAKMIAEAPWYLVKPEENQLKLAVKKDVCDGIKEYLKLEVVKDPSFKLLSTKEIDTSIEIPPAPAKPVFPPEIKIKDVREAIAPKVSQPPKPERLNHPKANVHDFLANVPKYRSKSGSTSSINSIGNESNMSSKKYSSTGENYSGYCTPTINPVSPFTEANYPKPLTEGCQELIYISHIVNPHNFYVQRACHQDLVKEMLREFRNANTMARPSINNVVEGKIYLVVNKNDNEGQRCRIVRVDRRDMRKPIYHVYSIDFGTSDEVTIDDLRVLPAARLHSPLPLAIHCSLANCKPANGSWSLDDSVLIQKIIDNKQAVMFIRSIRSSNFIMTCECDIITFEHGVSLAHALVFHERADLINPRLPYPVIPSLIEPPKVFVSNTDFKPKTTEEVIITHVVSPDCFYVRKSYLEKTYETLCEEMKEEYGSRINEYVYCPEVGAVYAAKVFPSPDESIWARVRVEERGRRRVRARLLDVGHVVSIHYTALAHVTPEHTKLKALATECHLSGVMPLNKKWSPKSVAILEKFVNRTVEIHIEEVNRDRNGGSVGVTLYDNTDPDNIICINSEMLANKLAISIGLFKFNMNIEDQVYTKKNPLDKPPRKEPKIKPGQMQILKREKPVSPRKPIKKEDLDAKDKGPIKLEVKVLSCQSPSLIYVALIDQQKIFNELFDSLQEFYTQNSVPGRDQWNVGDRCCAICTETKTWRRAVISEIDGNHAKVFYSDFACMEKVPTSSLKELIPEFTKIGDAAIKCTLSGVNPAIGKEWPSLTKEYLCELIDAYKRIFITKNGAIKDKSLPVEMWVYHVIQGDALEPNKAEWRCLNKNIIEQGLGIPDRSNKDKVEDKNETDAISFLNITGSIQEWLQLEPVPTEAELKLVEALKPAPKSSPKKLAEEDQHSLNEDSDYKDDNTLIVTDWLPSEPLETRELTGEPTYIDNNGVIYFHDIKQRDALDLIRKALDARFQNSDPKSKYVKWVVGQPCIAKFYLDKLFYRGKVVEVNYETSTCLIQYVDYGNEELCSFEDIRNTIVLYQIPIQARKAILGQVKPRKGQWDKSTLDYIHKSIVEKECFIKVCGQLDDMVEVKIKIDKVYINDLLVDLGMAVYNDGTKPMVAKFISPATKLTPVETIPEYDSGPDFIIETDDDATIKTLDKSLDQLEIKDWNQLMTDDDDVDNISIHNYYVERHLDNEFQCRISFINDIHLELSTVCDEIEQSEYDELFALVQESAANLPEIQNTYENQPCLALYSEDNQWYRAKLLQFSREKDLAKVYYVDFGNNDTVPVTHLRCMPQDLLTLPPAVVSATLYNVVLNPELDEKIIRIEYENTFNTTETFQAKIVENKDDKIYVELYNSDGNLVYENMIKKGIFLLN